MPALATKKRSLAATLAHQRRLAAQLTATVFSVPTELQDHPLIVGYKQLAILLEESYTICDDMLRLVPSLGVYQPCAADEDRCSAAVGDRCSLAAVATDLHIAKGQAGWGRYQLSGGNASAGESNVQRRVRPVRR